MRRILAWDDAALPVPDLLQHLAAAGIAAVTHSPDWTTRALADADEFTAGVTGTLAGLADTGSILVVSGPGRLRSASLVPRALRVRVGDIYPDLAGWLQDADRMLRAANIVVITGPSRTADIELNLVIGVHGPGRSTSCW
ncbi:MAG: LUD domain-containing protein [Anaerolineae bacterium]|nr:MAG: LUD domain-containing protein [Anaerolineae bacterium]